MGILTEKSIGHANRVPSVQQTTSLSGLVVDQLLNSNVILAGEKQSDIVFMQIMLQNSGFRNITTAFNPDDLMMLLRNGIRENGCDIDLVIIDSELSGMTADSLRLMMNQFEEWHLIPIISLIHESHWNYTQSLTDIAHGVTSLLYSPQTAESLSPSVMTALAIKKERDKAHVQKVELEEELDNLRVLEARLKFSIEHDELTGLSNRRKLEHALESSLAQARKLNTTSILFYIDLDRFKVLNDAEGHVAGDALLVQLANSFRSFFGTEDLLVRIGSDEFAVLIDRIAPEEAYIKAENLRRMLDGYSFDHMGNQYHLSASIGAELISATTHVLAGDVLAHANQACYTAKKRGRNRVHVYCPEDREMDTLRHSVQWAPRIRDALKYSKFFLEFQPIHSVKSDQISHYECLIRMKGDNNKIYYPTDFIPVAEAMGLIQQIDLWVVNHVFDLISSLPDNLAFTINLSGNIFLDHDLYPLVKRKLAETHVEPARIVFEITETSAISNFEQTKMMVNKLRSLGCRFALDDFGAGFNSYNYLKHFPVDILKIDGGFITNLQNDSVDQLLVKSMIDIAHSLGKQTVAEYVEQEETMQLLTDLGIDYIQGFLIGKPKVALLTA